MKRTDTFYTVTPVVQLRTSKGIKFVPSFLGTPENPGKYRKPLVLFRTNESIVTSRLQDNEDFKHFYPQKIGVRPKRIAKISENVFLNRSHLTLCNPPKNETLVQPFPRKKKKKS
jgi:hypothetical protein